MNPGLTRSFVIVPKSTIGGPAAEERVEIGRRPEQTRLAEDFGAEADPSFLFKLRAATGVPVRWLAKLMWFSPVILVAKLVMGAIDRPASDILVPVFATLVTFFFASVCLFVLASFIWWVASGRHAKPGLLAPEPTPGEETFEGIATELSPGESVLLLAGGTKSAHFVRMCAFAVVRSEGPPLVIVPTRMPRVAGNQEDSAALTLPRAAVETMGEEPTPPLVVVRPGDRVRVTGARVDDIANAESFAIDGEPASIAMRGDGNYRSAASTSALLVADGRGRMTIEKLAEPA